MYNKYISIKESNQKIIELIKSNDSFIVSRLGLGPETYISHEYDVKDKLNLNYLHKQSKTLYNAGIYFKDGDYDKLLIFVKLYNKCIKNSDLLACFNINQSNHINAVQNYYSSKFTIHQIHSRTLEPFYQVQENIKPWTHFLHGKKVLIINPFVESFKKQLASGFKIFKDENKSLFLPGQEFVFYKSYQTIAGNHIHDSWFDTFLLMCKDISKLEFDIALLGCGGYGLPLCNFIKTNMNKSAIYIGGGLQLLFGVMGRRWENNEMWKQIIKENDTQFIKPSNEEICENSKNIEGGCYW
jgi:hypothetical protein